MSVTEEALRKILNDLQSKAMEANRQLTTVKAQMQSREREKRMSELTKNELLTLDAKNTVVYQSVGKMFIQEPLPKLTGELKDRVVEMDKEMAALDKKRIYWERNMVEAQGNLQELMKQLQQGQ